MSKWCCVPMVTWLIVGCVPNEPRKDPPPAGTASAERKATVRPPRPAGSAASRLRPPRAAAAPRASAARPTVAADPLLTAPFSDSFDRKVLGPAWRVTSARWRIEDGQLCVSDARNHPVWLRRRLPVNARIEFDATSYSPDGDIKAEFWGDGRSAARAVSYESATSYLTIFGGWKNTFHVLARINEHAEDRPEVRLEASSDDPRRLPVAPRQSYHFKVERSDARTVKWFVDDLEILKYEDPAPLAGPGHEYFGFNNWQVRVCFDNLTVTPLQ